MLKKTLLVASSALLLLSACNNNTKNQSGKTEHGIEYTIIEGKSQGNQVKMDDILTYHIQVMVGDSTLMDSRKLMEGKPLTLKIETMEDKSMDLSEVVVKMKEGDSAVIYTKIDSFTRMQLPFIKENDRLQYRLKVESAQSNDAIIAAYLKDKNLQPQKTNSGLMYIIEQEGDGPVAQAGQDVQVNYTGRTFDGTAFDSNVDSAFNHVEPFTFKLGQGSVIKGWDEGIALLKKGSKAKLIIPYDLAYGARGSMPNIMPFSNLVFDVELVDVK